GPARLAGLFPLALQGVREVELRLVELPLLLADLLPGFKEFLLRGEVIPLQDGQPFAGLLNVERLTLHADLVADDLTRVDLILPRPRSARRRLAGDRHAGADAGQ